ncbi:MICAL-like protein 2 [Photinus pyralis]|uniref:Calponin-homology (CH) domain-containing protein n=3 Tax=Photinus pyralis TaxID=7054 RepID=A0A1Y1KBY2_PHOPY|nr:MICAL-like protein 2 [Photinus pyralis]
MGERRGTKGLELWCRRMTEGYPGVAINNMTTSWRDGLGFCAIIHHFRPDLIDFSKLNKEDIYYNNDLAFQTAERHLGIPALLEPEDMVEYPVPDRLSILTYLSQYYQTFVVAQGSPSRIVPKRPNNASVGGVVSPSSKSPSPKIPRPSGGVGRREPCAKCRLPVFIAERLSVGKQLYHRTCFRCARCNSQLALANYYETEIENQFCCEVCPDEEKLQPDKSVLTRSLSDEEKSIGLQKFDDQDDYTSVYETALDKQTVTDSARSAFFTTHLADEEVPELPKSMPPIIQQTEPPDIQRVSESVVTTDKDLSNDSNSIISAPFESFDSGYPSIRQEDAVVYSSDKLSDDVNKNQQQTAIESLDFESTKETKTTSNDNRISLVKSRALLFESKLTQNNEIKSPQKSAVPLESPIINSLDESINRLDNHSDDKIEQDVKTPSRLENHSDVEDKPIKVDQDLTPSSVKDEEYPEDLNPFGDNLDDTPKPAIRKKFANKRAIEPKPYNPFDEDDDDLPVPVEPTIRVSTNPFDTDDDEPEEEVQIRQKPVPLPRNSRSLVNTPEPKPRKLSLPVSKEIYGSSTSLNSAHSSIGTSRKKKPAPKPPTESPRSSVTSSPCVSVQHSPKTTPKIRKNKKAPLPPTITSTPVTNLNTMSLNISAISHDSSDWSDEKIMKDEVNRNRQSQIINSPESPLSEDYSIPNKSTYGKWKRRKGPAPSRPIPQRRHINPLPIGEIKRELEFIEIQQQGLEKQGVKLEQIIREKCEGPNEQSNTTLSPEVDDLILQLFDLVNEKNDLFRKQAELMYLRRQQRLEEEYADLEYQIRCLMLQPEINKTDSDKAREEELITRLVEVVERRNEIVECLEMDRIREAEEDDSINNQLTLYTLKREDLTAKMKDDLKQKKKKKDKKFKLRGSKKTDADKDVDESECSTVTIMKEKKKKKFSIF